MKPFLFFVLLVVPFFISAQNRSNIWQLGYSLYSSPSSELRYENEMMDTFRVNRVLTFFDTNTSICDTRGNLLLYSNSYSTLASGAL
jgi:hypothetical protein